MKFGLYILFSLSFIFVNAQNNNDYFNPEYSNSEINNNYSSLVKNNKVKYSLTAGTSIGSGLAGGNIVNTCIAPAVLLPINNKLLIETGVLYNKEIYNNYSQYNFYAETQNSAENFSGNTSQLFFYAKAYYKLSEKLTITGSVYKSTVLNTTVRVNNSVNPQAFNLETQGYTLGILYKVSENASLEFQFNYNKGVSPYYSPLNNMSQFNNGIGLQQPNSIGF